jgi:hypothetical protein
MYKILVSPPQTGFPLIRNERELLMIFPPTENEMAHAQSVKRNRPDQQILGLAIPRFLESSKNSAKFDKIQLKFVLDAEGTRKFVKTENQSSLPINWLN